MPRYAFLIEYDGAPFAGWQRQLDHPSVQHAIETVLTRLSATTIEITGAGRTDSGVHARGQVAHVDLPKAWDPYRLSQAVNAHLRPLPIAILDCAAVTDDFHARFSANRRDYRYRVIARRAPLTLDLGLAWQVPNLDQIEAMRAAARHLIGHHDFTTFRSSHCQALSPLKTLDKIDIVVSGETVDFHLSARSFLHNQVRSIVGTLERVGAGRWSPDDVAKALIAKDRAACGPVAPPDGLSLMAVGYTDDPFASLST
ncbi:MAG: tRNA pseudouridine(38-40) synthase TruA [Deltaproteobacteria bacterium]